MALPVFPIERALVPETVVGPAGFAKVEQRLVAGLPATIALVDGISLVLSIATGVVNAWRDADAYQVVTQSFDEAIALPTGPRRALGAVERTPARLAVVRGGEVLGTFPLTAGIRRRMPNSGEVAVEVIVIGWEIRAGSLRGAGDFGSSIRFVWRRADRATDAFLPPLVDPMILSRLRDRSRGASELGRGLQRLPAGYGPPLPPAAPTPPAQGDADIVRPFETVYVDEYYTTYDIP